MVKPPISQTAIADRKLIKQLTQAVAKSYTSMGTDDRSSEVPLQTGALPWRVGGKKGIEVLLVTSRRSGRWTIPKGWPMPRKTLAQAAEQEAFEEAGVTGTIDPRPLGTFRAVKQLQFLSDIEVDIVVHPLWVNHEVPEWPEFGQRKRRWFSAKNAARRVDSHQLADLILQTIRHSLRDRAKR